MIFKKKTDGPQYTIRERQEKGFIPWGQLEYRPTDTDRFVVRLMNGGRIPCQEPPKSLVYNIAVSIITVVIIGSRQTKMGGEIK